MTDDEKLASNYRRGRHRGPCRSALDVIRQLNVIAVEKRWSDEEIARRAGVHPWTLSLWRRGVRSPTLQNVEAVLGALGYRLEVVPDNERD